MILVFLALAIAYLVWQFAAAAHTQAENQRPLPQTEGELVRETADGCGWILLWALVGVILFALAMMASAALPS